MTFTATPLNQDDATRALAHYLEIKYSEAQELIDNETFRVYTEDDAIEVAGESIRGTLWAFNQNFICNFSNVACNIPPESWTRMAGELCEDFNDAVEAMIEAESDMDDFIEAAIRSDGLGHFLNTYDGDCQDSDDFATCNLDDTYIICQIDSY